MIPRVSFDDDYCEQSNEKNNYDENIGLSLNSQELIRELHEALFNEEPAQRKFEEIVLSILEDIKKYRSDYKRLEIAYKSEKERYDESIKQLLDEAEHQLSLAAEKVKKAERQEADKLIEKLKQQHEAEISSLQLSLNRMIALEKKFHETKIAEENKKMEFKKTIENISDEKKNLTINLREYQTQISLLRSEIAQLRTIANDKEVNRQKTNTLGKESIVLKNEINILQETNKMLNDTNDILLNEITVLKAKLSKKSDEDEKTIENQMPSFQTISSTPIEKSEGFNKRFAFISRSRIADSYETDDEEDYSLNGTAIDSGIWQTNNESMFENEKAETNATINKIDISSSPIMSSVPSLYSRNLSQSSTPKRPDITFGKKQENVQIQVSAEKFFKLVFAGDSAVGKTSFIMRYCRGEFTSTTSATLGVDFYMKSLNVDNEKEVQLQLWDTCGQERFRSIAKSYFRRADGVVLMYDVTCEQSFLNVREWIQTITDITDRTIPIIIIGNKTDLRDSYAKNGTRVIDYQEGLKFAKDYKALFVETSIKENTNVENSLVNLCKIMAENEDQTASNSIQIKLQSLTNINTKKFFSFKNRCC